MKSQLYHSTSSDKIFFWQHFKTICLKYEYSDKHPTGGEEGMFA